MRGRAIKTFWVGFLAVTVRLGRSHEVSFFGIQLQISFARGSAP